MVKTKRKSMCFIFGGGFAQYDDDEDDDFKNGLVSFWRVKCHVAVPSAFQLATISIYTHLLSVSRPPPFSRPHIFINLSVYCRFLYNIDILNDSDVEKKEHILICLILVLHCGAQGCRSPFRHRGATKTTLTIPLQFHKMIKRGQ